MSSNAEQAKKVYAIDAMPLLYRGHFAFLNNPMVTSKGVNVSALFGFATTLTQVLAKENPSHVVVVFDSDQPTFRHKRYPDYKAHRDKAPQELLDAIPLATELAEALNVKVLRVPKVEADDVLGTIARISEHEGMPCCVVTPDKDAAQLVSDKVSLMRPGRGNAPAVVWGVDDVCRKWSLASPLQVIDMLGLMGDASDNIPGVPGVGEKTAVKLLKQFGSVENLLQHADALKGKLRERVETHKDQARLSRELVEIKTDVELEISLDDLRFGDPDPQRLKTFLAEYEMHSIADRLLGRGEGMPPLHDDYDTAEEVDHQYHLVSDPVALDALMKKLKAVDRLTFDTETTSVKPREARLVGVSFAVEPHEAWYVPVPEGADNRARTLDAVKTVLEEPSVAKIGHNLKYDIEVLHRHGIEVAGPLYDTLLAHYVLDPGERHGMDHLCRMLLGYSPIPISTLIGDNKGERETMDRVDVKQVCEYAAEDADLTLQLHLKLSAMLKEAGAEMAMACENALLTVLLDMEREGIRVDPDVLKSASMGISQEVMSLEREIHDLGKGPFNVASPKQLGEVLFDRLQIVSKPKKTKSGQYATHEQVLTGLLGKHAIVGKILEHRAASKLKNTYLDKLPSFIDSETGRIHSTFRQAVTETGRLASQDPNLQNIPVRSERGRLIRAAFVARDDDHVIMSADYSQVELRIMASLSGDTDMIAAFERGEDIHAVTAAKVNGVMQGLVTREMRSQAKMVNFGIIYGISAFGLSQRLHVPRKIAAALIDSYFEEYPGVKAFMDETIAFAREHGYVKTMLGRRRVIRDIDSRNATARKGAERNAINSPIQGSAADMIKLAMVGVHQALEAEGLRSRVILQIHDELLLDVYRSEVDAVRDLVITQMKEALPLRVPVVVDVGVGEGWLEAH